MIETVRQPLRHLDERTHPQGRDRSCAGRRRRGAKKPGLGNLRTAAGRAGAPEREAGYHTGERRRVSGGRESTPPPTTPVAGQTGDKPATIDP